MTATPPTAVPDDEAPAAECAHCGRPFRSERAHDLHVGEEHDDLSPQERAAHDAAVDAEADELFLFHIKVIAAIVLLYAAFVIGYMVLLGLS